MSLCRGSLILFLGFIDVNITKINFFNVQPIIYHPQNDYYKDAILFLIGRKKCMKCMENFCVILFSLTRHDGKWDGICFTFPPDFTNA